MLNNFFDIVILNLKVNNNKKNNRKPYIKKYKE